MISTEASIHRPPTIAHLSYDGGEEVAEGDALNQRIQVIFSGLIQYVKNSSDEEVPENCVFLSSKELGSIDLSVYFHRIAKDSLCSDEALIASIAYLLKSLEKKELKNTGHEQFVIHASTIHKLFFTAVVIAAKWIDDQQLRNKDYAPVGKVSSTELFKMESAFCSLFDWNLSLDPADYLKVEEDLRIVLAPSQQ